MSSSREDLWDAVIETMNPDSRVRMTEWFEGRPPEIQALARRYPPGTRIRVRGVLFYLVGYGETYAKPGFLISKIDPQVDYEGAVAAHEFLCGEHLPEED